MRRLAAAVACCAAVLPAAAQSPGSPKVIVLSVVQGRLAGVPDRTVRVAQGDAVVLRWRTDRDIVLHLHGYDIETKVAAGRSADVLLAARLPGRFPISEHSAAAGHHHKAVAYLEVHPGS